MPAVQSALEALPAIGVGNVVATVKRHEVAALS
jgi:hypothetical protein